MVGRRAGGGVVRAAVQPHRVWLPVVLTSAVLALVVVNAANAPGALRWHGTWWAVPVFALATIPVLLSPFLPFPARPPDVSGRIPVSSSSEPVSSSSGPVSSSSGPDAGVVPSRAWTLVWVVAAVAVAVVGGWLYRGHAPSGLDVVAVELGGAGQKPLAATPDLGLLVAWDFAFIVGYGTALWMLTTAARWVFWSPPAAAAARFGQGCAVVVVLADMVENCFLGLAWRWAASGSGGRSGSGSGWSAVMLEGAAAAARIKFALLVPAVLIAGLGLVVVVGRLVSSWFGRGRGADPRWNWRWTQLRTQAPLEVPAEQGADAAVAAAVADTDAVAVADGEVAGADAAGEPEQGAVNREVQRRWAYAYHVPDVEPEGVGFCLSGGGIRSACVSLGVLQVLREELRGARYLVSVSGGGYTAGALAQALSRTAPPQWLPAGAVVDRDPDDAYRPGTVEVDHLRRHASYLSATPAEMVVALGVLARGLLTTLVLLFAPAVVLGIAVAWFYGLLPLAVLPELAGGTRLTSTQVTAAVQTGTALQLPSPQLWAAVAAGAAALLVWLVQVWLHARDPHRAGRAYARVQQLSVFATRAALVVVIAVIGLPFLLWVSGWLADAIDTHVRIGLGGAIGSVVLSYLASLAAFGWKRRTTIAKLAATDPEAGPTKAVAVPNGLLQLLLVVVSVTVLCAGWLVLFGISAIATVAPLAAGDRASSGWTALVLLVVAGALATLFDESSLSLHPFYRKRLATAFATRRVRLPGGHEAVAVPYHPREPTWLADYTPAADLRMPTFVYAAAANVTRDHRTPPGLHAVSYTFSQDWCGGPDVGWVRTQTLSAVCSRRLQRDLTVQGAVAISGAAIASAMGRMARWYELLLAISGARLGAWLPNPGFIARMRAARGDDGRVRVWTLPGLPSVRRAGYLVREVFHLHAADDRLLHVTDGGHYENLGLVELLRRRCTTIYCVDGGGDSPPTAQGLVDAITLASAELGVRIELHDPLALEPGSGRPLGDEASLAALNAALSREPVITGTITYPRASGLPRDRRGGRLYVAKASLWPTMPYPLLSYAARHPEFPHDSTGDQWFDDGQFTAYTSLGRELGSKLRQAASPAGLPVPPGQRTERPGRGPGRRRAPTGPSGGPARPGDGAGPTATGEPAP